MALKNSVRARRLYIGTVGRVAAGIITVAALALSATPAASATAGFSPSVVATIAVGSSPSAIAVSSAAVYVANTDADTISVIDPSRQQVTSTLALDAGSAPSQLLVLGDYLYVLNPGRNSVSVFSTISNTLMRSILVGSSPRAMAACGDELWVTNHDSNSLSVISLTTNTLATGFSNPIALTGSGPGPISMGEGKIYVGFTVSTAVTIFMCSTHAEVTTVNFSFPVAGFAATEDYMGVFVSGRPSAYFIDYSTNLASIEISLLAIANGPYAAVRFGLELFIAGKTSDTVADVLFGAPGVATLRAPATSLPAGTRPTAIATSGTSIYIAGGSSGVLSILSPYTRAITATVRVGSHPIALAPRDRYVYVVNHDDNTVSVVDLEASPPAPAGGGAGKPSALAATGAHLAASLAAAGGLIALGAAVVTLATARRGRAGLTRRR